uniref:hypothetical protein n=1 Tax=Acetatifactor sp. TaxID=1872090 RepID=UPI00405609CA
MIQKNAGNGERLLSCANMIVRIFGSIIFVILTWYAFRYTQYIIPGGREIPTDMQDSILGNLFFVVAGGTVFLLLFESEKRISKKAQQIIMYVVLIVAMAWIGLLGFWWITAVDRVPVGDQAFIYGGASYFLEGQYFFLGEGGYCSMYPHQLGLIALVELLFLVVGTYNYYAFQVICVLLTLGIVYVGFRIVCLITEHKSVAMIYCLSMMGCLPLAFYTDWVYGDIPSIFFALLTAYMLLKYDRRGKIRYLVGIVFSITMALLVRKNSMILLIALCLAGGVYCIRKKDKRMLVSLIVAVLLPILTYQGIYKIYEMRSGHERYDEIPTLSWVVMGMQENQGIYGWYNDYGKQVFYANDCNAEYANVMIKLDLEERLEEFQDNPFYARKFYKGKILSQWNEPLYQSIYFSNMYSDETKRPDAGTLVSKVSNEYFFNILVVCDRMQCWVYLGVVCYFLFAVKRNSNILQHLLAIALIGGFLFSIIWEAKARYILPYYVTMFPCAVIGFEQMYITVRSLWKRLCKTAGRENEKTAKAA